MDEYKILQQKIDKIGEFRFTFGTTITGSAGLTESATGLGPLKSSSFMIAALGGILRVREG